MGRNLYIFAATLGFLALACYGLSFANIARQPGSPGDVAMWRMMAIGLLVVTLVVTLAGNLSTLFAQAERRADQQREEKLRQRRERRQQ